MIGYRSRLRKDVERWQQAGWLTAEAAEAIRAEAAAGSGRRFGLAAVLGVLGAVLIGFAAMSFVAANWQSMSKLARLGLLFAALWGSYGLAGLFYLRGFSAFANAAVLAAVALFGASIMLIAQMYHMDGNPPDAVLIWALGAILAGFALRSNAVLAAAVVLAVVWSDWETALRASIHWAYLPLWGLIGAGFLWMRWRPGLHLMALSLSSWIIVQEYANYGLGVHWPAALIGVLVAVLAVVAAPYIDRIGPLSKAVSAHGAALGFAGLYDLQFLNASGIIDYTINGRLVVLAILTLALLIAAVFWGALSENRGLAWVGYAGFSLELLSLYFKTLGTLLGTSMFFLIAGLLVILLAYLAFQLHKRQLHKRQLHKGQLHKGQGLGQEVST